ncbi:MAG: trypsin-like peptidase domain-containing protein [Bacilli bacterium]|nr:trypsin-like peptidase domain-containing protein [Bacilli bacterium]
MKEKFKNGLVLLVVFLLGGLCMFCINQVFGKTKVNTVVKSTDTSCKACPETVIVENGNLSAAVDKVYNSSVMIKTSNGNRLIGSGSGFVYKVDEKYNYIITNHHVIKSGDSYKIVNYDDEEITAKLLGSDEYLDIAILQIEKREDMPAVAIGKSTELKLGDTAFTVGTPVGYEYHNTVTSGIISGLDREVEVSLSNSYSKEDYVMEAIQTNAAVNPGNSGGALVNAKGEVVGVISMKLVDSSIEGMGFAIPIEMVMANVSTLESGKKIERPLLGIQMLDVTDSWQLMRQGITLDADVDSGVVVVEINEKSGASKSDLKKGDVITKINDSEVKDSAYLKYLLFKYKPGDEVTLTYYRDKKFYTTKIKLTKNEG